MSHLNNYSNRNLRLILSQKSWSKASSFFQTVERKTLGRHVKKRYEKVYVFLNLSDEDQKDENNQPILIKWETRNKVTFFGLVPVFDVSQTEGREREMPKAAKLKNSLIWIMQSTVPWWLLQKKMMYQFDLKRWNMDIILSQKIKLFYVVMIWTRLKLLNFLAHAERTDNPQKENSNSRSTAEPRLKVSLPSVVLPHYRYWYIRVPLTIYLAGLCRIRRHLLI